MVSEENPGTSSDALKVASSMPSWWLLAVGAVGIPAIMAGGLFVLASWPLWSDLNLCDAAIMAKLKAPATYRRINAPDGYSASNFTYRITYDAENSFGVPLRSAGYCTVNSRRTAADWAEMPGASF